MTKRVINLSFTLTGNEYFDHIDGEFKKPTLKDDINLALDVINYIFDSYEDKPIADGKFYITEGDEVIHLSQTLTPNCKE